MIFKISILSPSEIFVGLRFSISKLVSDVQSYDPSIEYPKAYSLEIGLLFITIDITKKGRL